MLTILREGCTERPRRRKMLNNSFVEKLFGDNLPFGVGGSSSSEDDVGPAEEEQDTAAHSRYGSSDGEYAEEAEENPDVSDHHEPYTMDGGDGFEACAYVYSLPQRHL